MIDPNLFKDDEETPSIIIVVLFVIIFFAASIAAGFLISELQHQEYVNE